MPPPPRSRPPRPAAATRPARYPETELAKRLELVARSIKAGSTARVYYVIQSGYDSHAVQLPTQAQLLREFAGAVRAFLDDLAAAKLADRVVVMAFSEFGRRPEENGSLGTDHGTAGPVFLAGRVREGRSRRQDAAARRSARTAISSGRPTSGASTRRCCPSGSVCPPTRSWEENSPRCVCLRLDRSKNRARRCADR